MGRVYRKPKEVEAFLIREFVCDALHYTVSRAEWCERPDAILTLRKGRTGRQVAIELTGYFNDTTAGRCSPLTPLSGFWKRVQRSLARRISHRLHLADLMGTVRLNATRFVGQPRAGTQEHLARQLAGQIVEFLETHPTANTARFPSHSSASPRSEFSEYPLLKSMVASMSVQRVPGAVLLPRCSWRCGNITTGCIGLNLDNVKASVKSKNKKAAKYDWRAANEKWLLIVAACGNLSEHAGAPEEQKWDDLDLKQANGDG